jgi:hypothetical protein
MEPTKEQINALEQAHKQQFILLVRAAILWQVLYKKFNGDVTNPILKNYSQTIISFGNNWLKRNKELQQAGVPGVNISMTDFFYHFDQVKNLANSFLAPGQDQIGFIPIIIALVWATVWIVGFFTAAKLADHLNTTANEKADLLKVTAQTCKDANLSDADCAKILSQTQAEASSTGQGFSDAIKWGLIALIGIFALKQFSPSK